MKFVLNGTVREKSSKKETWQDGDGRKEYDVNLLSVFVPEGDGLGESVTLRVRGDIPTFCERGCKVNVEVKEVRVIKGLQHIACDGSCITMVKK